MPLSDLIHTPMFLLQSTSLFTVMNVMNIFLGHHPITCFSIATKVAEGGIMIEMLLVA